MIALALTVLLSQSPPVVVAPGGPALGPWGPPVTWREGTEERAAYVNPGLLAELNPTDRGARAVKALDAAASSRCPTPEVCLWTVTDARAALRALAADQPGNFAPVLHDEPSSRAALRVAVGVVVLFPRAASRGAAEAWLAAQRVALKRWAAPGMAVVQSGPGVEALALAARLAVVPGAELVVPDWWRPMQGK